MNKKKLREKYKILREQLPSEKQLDLSVQIANQLLKMNLWQFIYFHIFLNIPKKNEVNTQPILDVLWGKNKNVLVSASDFDTFEMRHFLLNEHTKIKKNIYEIPEPVEGIEVQVKKIQVVIIPLLAYDFWGNRVGYGKGFYDRFLEKTKAIKIGVSFFAPEKEMIDTSKYDVKLDYCICPEKIYKFAT